MFSSELFMKWCRIWSEALSVSSEIIIWYLSLSPFVWWHLLICLFWILNHARVFVEWIKLDYGEWSLIFPWIHLPVFSWEYFTSIFVNGLVLKCSFLCVFVRIILASMKEEFSGVPSATICFYFIFTFCSCVWCGVCVLVEPHRLTCGGRGCSHAVARVEHPVSCSVVSSLFIFIYTFIRFLKTFLFNELY